MGTVPSKGGPRGPPPGQAPPWRGQGVSAPPGRLGQGAPLRLPFGIYLAVLPKTYREPPVTRFHLLFRRYGYSDLGIARRTYPGMLAEGGLTFGGFYITMIASVMHRE